MDFLNRVSTTLTEERFLVNLIAAHALVLVIVMVSLSLRRLLWHGTHHLARMTDGHWLDPVSRKLTHHARMLLFWLTMSAILLSTLTALGYHLAGRDIRVDMESWYRSFTLEELLQLSLTAGGLIVVGLLTWITSRCITRLLPSVESHLSELLGPHSKPEALRRWFQMLERFALAACYLTGAWATGQILGAAHLADALIGFVLRVTTILAVARLLILACPAVSRLIADAGTRELGQGPFRHYWEPVTRLFPFGERCFEAAVYISAASLCVRELNFIAVVADFGPRLVRCIGIFFGTRVAIELSQVLLNEAFGMYREDKPIDAKGRTLVPLLHSLCQYVLYFGSTVVMLGVLGVDTGPLLAGAGILGLGVGLGAQSLVTDVVSGFFILFENQYLVGDYVQINDASGTVEAVGIRVTQVRDGYGKLYIIPNGQIKGVVNYSKSYVNAVVDVHLARGSDLEKVFRGMAEAGRLMRQANKEVLAETEIQGLIELGTSEMTVRAVTKVQPGNHLRMENEYRRLLKQVFDKDQAREHPSLAA